jgi:hypothetical protein
MDVARAERDLGLDPRPSLDRARELFAECGAVLRLGEVEAMLEEMRTS